MVLIASVRGFLLDSLNMLENIGSMWAEKEKRLKPTCAEWVKTHIWKERSMVMVGHDGGSVDLCVLVDKHDLESGVAGV